MNTNRAFDEQRMRASAQADQSMVVTIAHHPLADEALATMRDRGTEQAAFRNAVHSLASFLIYAATANLNEREVEIETPLAPVVARRVSDKVVLVPILRSGVGMLEPAQQIFPKAPVLFAGMKRDEKTALPNWYRDMEKLDNLQQRNNAVFLVLDPMLATGGSAVETINRIEEIYPHGIINMIAMIAAPEGVRAVNQAHPKVAITVAAVDDHLNDQKYIVPGLGDAGDRQFGTT